MNERARLTGNREIDALIEKYGLTDQQVRDLLAEQRPTTYQREQVAARMSRDSVIFVRPNPPAPDPEPVREEVVCGYPDGGRR